MIKKPTIKEKISNSWKKHKLIVIMFFIITGITIIGICCGKNRILSLQNQLTFVTAVLALYVGILSFIISMYNNEKNIQAMKNTNNQQIKASLGSQLFERKITLIFKLKNSLKNMEDIADNDNKKLFIKFRILQTYIKRFDSEFIISLPKTYEKYIDFKNKFNYPDGNIEIEKNGEDEEIMRIPSIFSGTLNQYALCYFKYSFFNSIYNAYDGVVYFNYKDSNDPNYYEYNSFHGMVFNVIDLDSEEDDEGKYILKTSIIFMYKTELLEYFENIKNDKIDQCEEKTIGEELNSLFDELYKFLDVFDTEYKEVQDYLKKYF